MVAWYIFIAFFIILLEGLLFQLRGTKSISYTRYFDRAVCTEGETVQMVECVINRSLIPIPWLRLESSMHVHLQFSHQANLHISQGSMYQHHRSMFSLMPFMKVTRRHQIRCINRGCYDLNTASLTTGDPLGLIKKSRTCDVSARILVYPSPLNLDDITLPSHSWQGDVMVKRWIVEDPFIISGVRQYQYGDPLNSVNWKATARTGQMQVYQRDHTADHHLMVCLNIQDSSEMWKQITNPELIEYELRYAAALVQYAIVNGIETGFGSNARITDGAEHEVIRIPMNSGEEQYETIMDTMAMLLIEIALPFDTFLEQEVDLGRKNTDYIVISPYVDHKIEAQIQELKMRGNAVKVMDLSTAEELQEGTAANG